jgi:aminopeptidase-like protein
MGLLDDATGASLHDLVRRLLPLPRSLTGDGVRRTLAVLGDVVPLEVVEVPSGTRVLDWEVPDEWTIREAWIARTDGTRVVDTADSWLHVLGHSEPVRRRVPLAELQAHLHSLPDQPDAVPFRTAYHQRTWGFCLTQAQRQGLVDDAYDVCVDADLAPGSLTYGELVVPGREPAEVLLSAHTCHPAMANDNLSGIVVAVAVAEWLRSAPRRLTYRLLLAPGTLGAITWLARNRDRTDRVTAGVVVSGVGDRGAFTYKRSRRGDGPADRAAALVLRDRPGSAVMPFTPWGYDERQFCSPGFDLPVGRLSRTPHGTYPEYHTSLDDLSFVSPAALREAADVLRDVVEVLEGDTTFVNLAPHGEPQLGRRGLFDGIGGRDRGTAEMALLWVLSASDGSASLVDVAERSGLPFQAVRAAADRLLQAELLAPAT